MVAATLHEQTYEVVPCGNSREEWLEARRTGIGASDMASLLNISGWGTPFHVWLAKVGGPALDSPTKEKRWGLKLEETIATAYEETTGRAVILPPKLIRSKQAPFMLASLDRVVEDAGIIFPLELKSASSDKDFRGNVIWGEPGSDHVPDIYNVQCQHQMFVVGAPFADIAVLIGLGDFRVYRIPRHDGLIETILRVAEDFWQSVVTYQSPEPSWEHPLTPALVTRLYGLDEELTVQLGMDAVEMLDRWEEAKDGIAAAKRAADLWKSRLLMQMGEAAVAYLPDGSKVTRKLVHVKAHEVAARDDVRLYPKRPKNPIDE